MDRVRARGGVERAAADGGDATGVCEWDAGGDARHVARRPRRAASRRARRPSGVVRTAVDGCVADGIDAAAAHDAADDGGPPDAVRAAAIECSGRTAGWPIRRCERELCRWLRLGRVGAKRSAAQMVEEQGSHTLTDEQLPGWLVVQRTTNTGRNYKVYHGPSGEYAESKRQAMLLASGAPISAEQLAFKSKPAPAIGGSRRASTAGASRCLPDSPASAASRSAMARAHVRRRGRRPHADRTGGLGPTQALQRSIERASTSADIEIVISPEDLISTDELARGLTEGVGASAALPEPMDESGAVPTAPAPAEGGAIKAEPGGAAPAAALAKVEAEEGSAALNGVADANGTSSAEAAEPAGDERTAVAPPSTATAALGTDARGGHVGNGRRG